jgi:hypothetical protein
MSNLYLVWRGTDSGDPQLYGIRTASYPPSFAGGQSSWFFNIIPPIGKPALLALSDRILLAYANHDSLPGITGTQTNGLVYQYCQSWPTWPSAAVPGTASAWGPSLVSWPGGALMVWNGLGNDTRVWTAIYHQAQNVWSPQYLTELANTGQPIQTGSTPAIVNFNGTLLMVWLGEGSNDNLYYALSTDGLHWQGNKGIPGAASSIAPALALYNNMPTLCFKGAGSDHTIYCSTYNAALDYWGPVVPTGKYGTSHGPSLAVYHGALFMTCKGINDTDMYWAVSTNPTVSNAWPTQQTIAGVGSNVGPSAVVF